MANATTSMPKDDVYPDAAPDAAKQSPRRNVRYFLLADHDPSAISRVAMIFQTLDVVPASFNQHLTETGHIEFEIRLESCAEYEIDLIWRKLSSLTFAVDLTARFDCTSTGDHFPQSG